LLEEVAVLNLERLIFVPRSRKKWEAVDLGFRLVPLFWKPMLLSWIIVSLPFFLLFSFIEPLSYYVTLVIWWLKPLFERTQLYILSFGVFSNAPSVKETVRAFPKYAFKQITPSLLWRRISFTRSLDLPVIQLENLSGEQRKKRLAILHKQAGNPASWLAIILVHVETMLMIGVFLVVLMLVPKSMDLSWFELLDDHVWLTNLIYYVCLALVAPFYVASGFMLYINRRIELEGWDIELNFKEIAELNKKPVPNSGNTSKLHSIAFIFLFLLGTLFLPQNELYAQTESVKRAEADILTVFEHEDFHQIETYQIPKWLDDWDFNIDDDEDKPKLDIPPFLLTFLMFIASSIEVIIWVVAISIVIFLIVRYRSKLAQFAGYINRDKTLNFETPKTMFGLDVRQDQLPNDIEVEGLKLIEHGDYRECLSLLYRATITKLLYQYRIPFSAANTELECLDMSHTHIPISVYEYFSSVTSLWRKLAYGHINPTRDKIEKLCREWNTLLGASAGKEEGAPASKEEGGAGE
jgi:hypothetical protein